MTLLQTDFLPNKPETFQALRYMMQDAGLQTGRVRAGDYKVTQHSTPNMTVDITAGSAWLIGTTVNRQGIYHQVNDGLVNVGNFANSDITNPRIDQVILVVNDSSAGGGSDDPQFAIVQGTPTAGATLDNRTGAVLDANINTAYRDSWVRWADVLIPAGSTSVINANIRDRGPWARGFRRHLQRTAGDYTITSTAMVIIDPGNLTPRVECNGTNEFEITMRSRFLSTAPALCALVPSVDGGSLYSGGLAPWRDTPPDTADHPIQVTFPFLPTAGSHVFGMNGSTASGSFTISASSTAPLDLTVIEIVRQNADNT